MLTFLIACIVSFLTQRIVPWNHISQDLLACVKVSWFLVVTRLSCCEIGKASDRIISVVATYLETSLIIRHIISLSCLSPNIVSSPTDLASKILDPRVWSSWSLCLIVDTGVDKYSLISVICEINPKAPVKHYFFLRPPLYSFAIGFENWNLRALIYMYRLVESRSLSTVLKELINELLVWRPVWFKLCTISSE